MTITNFTLTCDCGCPTPLMSAANASLEAWQALVAKRQITDLTCVACGCQYDPAANGQSIGTADRSKPRIDRLSPGTGSVLGGTTIAIVGHAFDVGTPVVRVNGIPAVNPRDVLDDSMTVDVPAGTLAICAAGMIRRKLTCTSVGTLGVGNVVRGSTSTVTAIVQEVGSGFIYVNAWSGEFQPGEPLVEQAPGTATGSVVAFKLVPQAGELLTGLTSGATTVLQAGFRATAPVGTFQGGETVISAANEAKFELASQPLDGRVDVTVENGYGMRVTGGRLVNGFSYS